MCGICGEYRVDGQLASSETITKMMTKLERRGPDFGDQIVQQNIAFGHRRLAVIDLSATSNQPMVDLELGLSIVFNGAIYNYPQLRQQLIEKGYSFISNGDTETILKAWHCWGERCVERFEGMFAFAIWDIQKKSLSLARDRMGIKPLYYSLENGIFRFASNMQALLVAGDVDTDIDPVALHHQYTLHGVVPAPHTIIKGVRKLEPAHIAHVDSQTGKVLTECYWRLEATRPEKERTESEWVEDIHYALKEAVRKRLEIADVPVGVLLSGGLDSSLLVGLLAESGVNDIRTYSVGFEDVGQEYGNEFFYSDQVVERFGTQHHKFMVANSDVLRRLPEAVNAMSEPMFGQDAVAFYLLSEQVSKDVKVVQSGQGADEVFGGYFWYPQMAEDTEPDDLRRFSKYYFDRDHDEYLQMVREKYRQADFTGALIKDHLSSDGADTFMDAVLRMDSTMLIVDDPVKRVDNMTMAWGLEARVPFLDHKLLEVAARCPIDIKLKDNGKYPLKAISRGLLPADVIDRPKGYFPMPALKYVRGDFLTFMSDILSADSAQQRGLFDKAYINRLLAEPEQHFTRIQGSKLWHCALLEYWLQENVD